MTRVSLLNFSVPAQAVTSGAILIWAARLTDNKVKQKKGKMVAGALKSGLNISFMNVELRMKD